MTTLHPASPSLVRRLLAGATQWRMPVEPQPPLTTIHAGVGNNALSGEYGVWFTSRDPQRLMMSEHNYGVFTACPFPPGAVVGFQEAWYPRHSEAEIGYRADDTVTRFVASDNWFRRDWQSGNSVHVWRHADTMPEWAVRIRRRVTGVRVERVQEISRLDCVCSGWRFSERQSEGVAMAQAGLDDANIDDEAIEWFADQWDADHPSHPWSSDPWSWVLTIDEVT
jgi:hypothetical protein